MKCVIPGQNVRVFAKAINTLSTIGAELHVEFLADELMIRAVSPTKSAYGSFTFHPDFFNDFRNDSAARRKQHQHRDVHSRFRFHMKTILPIFKANNIGEAFLESCDIEVDHDLQRMHFTFVKTHRVTHKHSFLLLETAVLETAYSKEDTTSNATASAHLITEIVSHFPRKVQEVTLTFQEHEFSVTNYTADVPDQKISTQMQLIMDMNEFESYEIDRPTALTCTLKELKGIVSFLSSDTGITGLPVKLYFSGPGVPLLMCIESPASYEASFVVATVEGGPGSLPSQASGNQVPGPNTGIHSSASRTVQPSGANQANGRQAEVQSPYNVSEEKESQPAPTGGGGGSFSKTNGPGVSSTKRLIGMDSRILTQRPSQLQVKSHPLVGASDEEDGSEDSGS